MLKRYRLALYTFAAVFAAVAVVCLLALPPLLDLAQQEYYELQRELTERQARSMEQFLLNRLGQGVAAEQVIEEFQATVVGTDSDSGYVCLIDQGEARYLGHPDTEVLGMTVKPGSMFERNFSAASTAWPDLIGRGDSGGGLLDINAGMMQEIIHFMPVPGTAWTVSAHENTRRIDLEIQRLRRALGRAGLLFAFILAFPASLAALQVSRLRAREVERANRLERRVLEAENSRKAEELESARRLQLSMLPTTLPSPPQVELAAQMVTASEVGGDYYDFDLAENGTLTAIVGDATGHGMQAGTMVATLKGLFTHCSREEQLESLLDQMAATLRRIGLPRMLVAVGLARLKGRRLELVGAGLPPALIYRAASHDVEQVSLDGIPLGGRMQSPVVRSEKELEPGDAVVLMTDGLPELLNEAQEELGYDRVVVAMAKLGAESAESIASGLRTLAREWAGEQGNQDDVTLVAMKIRGVSPSNVG